MNLLIRAERSPEPALVLIVASDPAERQSLREVLTAAGFRTVEYETGQRAIQGNGNVPAVACVDLGLSDIAAEQVIRQFSQRDPDLSVIAVANAENMESVTQALQAGAYDWVSRPVDPQILLYAVRRARERRVLLENVRQLEVELRECNVLDTIVGQSPGVRELARQVERVFHSDLPVCVHGERGTEQELVARAVHAGGHRRGGPLVIMNCAAVTASRQYAELFGHEPGAFMGASTSRRGRVQDAHNGVLYLERVEQLAAEAQAGLVDLLERGTIRRAGAADELQVNVRVIATTQCDLHEQARAGHFRPELWARLSGYLLHVPPLRERKEDIVLLVGRIVKSQATPGAAEPPRVSPEVLDALARYDWPGNVAELRDVIIRSLLACRGDEITLADVPSQIRRFASSLPPEAAARDDAATAARVVPLRELERRAIEAALKSTGGSVGKAARLLGIGRATLYRRLAALDLQRRPNLVSSS